MTTQITIINLPNTKPKKKCMFNTLTNKFSKIWLIVTLHWDIFKYKNKNKCHNLCMFVICCELGKQQNKEKIIFLVAFRCVFPE